MAISGVPKSRLLTPSADTQRTGKEATIAIHSPPRLLTTWRNAAEQRNQVSPYVNLLLSGISEDVLLWGSMRHVVEVANGILEQNEWSRNDVGTLSETLRIMLVDPEWVGAWGDDRFDMLEATLKLSNWAEVWLKSNASEDQETSSVELVAAWRKSSEDMGLPLQHANLVALLLANVPAEVLLNGTTEQVCEAADGAFNKCNWGPDELNKIQRATQEVHLRNTHWKAAWGSLGDAMHTATFNLCLWSLHKVVQSEEDVTVGRGIGFVEWLHFRDVQQQHRDQDQPPQLLRAWREAAQQWSFDSSQVSHLLRGIPEDVLLRGSMKQVTKAANESLYKDKWTRKDLDMVSEAIEKVLVDPELTKHWGDVRNDMEHALRKLRIWAQRELKNGTFGTE